MHLSKSTISSYERGQQLPPLDKLVCLADFFHVTTDYLLGRCDVSVSPDSLNAELLPHKTAASVIRDYILEKSPYEIAANLGIKPDSVRMALTRARKAAYALLAKE